MIFYLTAGVIATIFGVALWYVLREDFGCGLDCDNCDANKHPDNT